MIYHIILFSDVTDLVIQYFIDYTTFKFITIQRLNFPVLNNISLLLIYLTLSSLCLLISYQDILEKEQVGIIWPPRYGELVQSRGNKVVLTSMGINKPRELNRRAHIRLMHVWRLDL